MYLIINWVKICGWLYLVQCVSPKCAIFPPECISRPVHLYDMLLHINITVFGRWEKWHFYVKRTVANSYHCTAIISALRNFFVVEHKLVTNWLQKFQFLHSYLDSAFLFWVLSTSNTSFKFTTKNISEDRNIRTEIFL